jgi:hypothetical protein
MTSDLDLYSKKVWEYVKLEYHEILDSFNRLPLNEAQLRVWTNVVNTSISQSIEEHYEMDSPIPAVAGVIARVHLMGIVEDYNYYNKE